MKKIIFLTKNHLIAASIILSILAGLFFSLGNCILSVPHFHLNDIVLLWLIWSALLIYPAILTLANIASLIRIPVSLKLQKSFKYLEYITLLLGMCYSVLFLMITDIRFDADWSEQLINRQLHSPISTAAYPSVITFCLIGALGYFLLSWCNLEKLPPLVIVLSISGMYLGCFECIMWCIQICNQDLYFLCLLPINCILIAVKLLRYTIHKWNQPERHNTAPFQNKFLESLNRLLQESSHWPLAAFLMLLPLLGILIIVLVLFGQRPDSIISAWTNTADWRLSMQTAPPNLMKDEHYLCTVAAGGHKSVVKPLRMGERHGHRVVVNRQLCIANAFEQLLEEHTPVLHYHIRRFYDTYGFPIAKLIRTKTAADIVYFLMKPLEWFFLVILYLSDVKPENRIAVQYLPTKPN